MSNVSLLYDAQQNAQSASEGLDRLREEVTVLEESDEIRQQLLNLEATIALGFLALCDQLAGDARRRLPRE